MSHPADYIVVVSNEDDFVSGFHHFSEKVNRKLKSGYQLHGQPFAVDRLMCQAMVKAAGSHATVTTEASGDTTMFYHRTPQA